MFLSVNAKISWPKNNVNGVYLLVNRVWDIFLSTGPCWRILQTVRQPQRKLTNKTPLSLCEAPAASKSTFILGQLKLKIAGAPKNPKTICDPSF
jgi:hypothetical protein